MFASVSVASFVISCIPAAAMLVGSALALVLTLPNTFQAAMQNLSAGVILAAVGKELFPLMHHNGIFKDLGVVAGFGVALCFMFGLQKLESVLEGGGGDGGPAQDSEAQCTAQGTHAAPRRRSSISPPEFASFHVVTPPKLHPPASTKTSTSTLTSTLTSTSTSSTATNGSPTPELASENPLGISHDHHTFTVEELDNPKLPVMVLDALSEVTAATMGPPGSEPPNEGESSAAAMDDEMIQELDRNQRVHLLEHLEGLQSAIVQTRDYLSSDKPVAGEIDHKYIHSLQKLTTHIHEDVHVLKSVARGPRGSHRRSVSKLHPPPAELALGVIPITLIVAVTIDAMVDGFLIGVSYSALPAAGYSMALATCIEMCLLGITFSADLKPTLKHSYTHLMIVAVPPLALALAGFLGGLLGSALESVPFLFLAMIAFGVVALLFLVTQELLIDAHSKQEGREIWWINVWLFFGVLLGILVDFD